ncbi:uncharacterized protein F5891DRAFT_1034834 [Suillus fuscotomentosus]|uniref:Uncharacterized protein n=1 Tax=Suillus fuscotomentosus TaxID=1912939 RepID=A0AAD4E5U1_9AGAM|nr:uncharacterized protein F5891DRAFT_1034834 [Suillus fuscotomentosus]KAG1900249.1 hypothetical protein F5891DRAFT_1034834 [Suillus fuscotomentosus]
MFEAQPDTSLFPLNLLTTPLIHSHFIPRLLPYIGYVTIAMNDFPQLKYALLWGLGLLADIQRE